MRQAEISSFRGAPLLSVREFYEQNGQKLPGKKGLAMSLEQAEALLSFAPRLSAALQARETTEPLELSQKKRVAVSEFKGRVSVDLREYWEKDGDMVPGKKGISLPADQWDILCSNLPGLVAALKSA
ncbi:hypothetical protein H632_c857p1 [Helicosporidium sp. ATCC 50920]|nr:hypothetical protein H632_c857p1 [Helicosporidium sp. ATCC 50920]|eukprot:KDD75125.1 hypothetical protein H632_c857p1 [Helicosporidium sp. ATCC 50920]